MWNFWILVTCPKHPKRFAIISSFYFTTQSKVFFLLFLTVYLVSLSFSSPSFQPPPEWSQGSELGPLYFPIWAFFLHYPTQSLVFSPSVHTDFQIYVSSQDLMSPTVLTPVGFWAFLVEYLMRIQAILWTKQDTGSPTPTWVLPILLAHGEKKWIIPSNFLFLFHTAVPLDPQ